MRGALWGNELKSEGVHEFTLSDELVRLHLQQGTGALVFPVVLENADLPANIRLQMKSVCVHTMQQQVKLQQTLEMAWNALQAAGIKAVLMKGAGLAALYPEPQRRSWSDIDLFVGKQQYHPACAVMRDTFPKALKFDEELDHYKHYNLIADGVSIEIHRVSVAMLHPRDVRRYERMEKNGMDNASTLVIGGLSLQVPEPTFNALMVFLHSWEHVLTKGANIRQLCDFVLLLHHYAGQIDKARLQRYLQALHLTDVWQLYVWIGVQGLGLAPEQAPFFTPNCATRAERLLEDILHPMANDTPSHGPMSNRLRRKIHTMRERMQNARRIRPYSPSYARHMQWAVLLNGAKRLFAKDRKWE